MKIISSDENMILTGLRIRVQARVCHLQGGIKGVVRGVIQNKLQTAYNSKTIDNIKKSVETKVVYKNILSNFCFYELCLKCLIYMLFRLKDVLLPWLPPISSRTIFIFVLQTLSYSQNVFE
jgi:hypothetical protein